jgi:hypothetical protein
LVGVYQQVEAFLNNLAREQKLFGRPLDGPREGETVIAQTLRTLPGGTLANQQRLGRERLDLLDYYRLVRNGFAHAGDEDRLAKAFENVKVYRPQVSNDYGLVAPNPVDDLTHDDYLLATRLTKYLATDICRIAEPTGADEIINMMENGDFADNPISVITKRRNSEAIVRRGTAEIARANAWSLNSQQTSVLATPRTPFVSQTFAYTFADGRQTGAESSRPSPLENVVTAPARLVGGVVEAIASGVTGETGRIKAETALTEAETARLTAAARLVEAQAAAAGRAD